MCRLPVIQANDQRKLRQAPIGTPAVGSEAERWTSSSQAVHGPAAKWHAAVPGSNATGAINDDEVHYRSKLPR